MHCVAIINQGLKTHTLKDTWTITGVGRNRREVGRAGGLGWGGRKRQKSVL